MRFDVTDVIFYNDYHIYRGTNQYMGWIYYEFLTPMQCILHNISYKLLISVGRLQGTACLTISWVSFLFSSANKRENDKQKVCIVNNIHLCIFWLTIKFNVIRV